MIITQEDVELHRYRELVIAEGKVVGAILLGYPLDAPAVTEVIKQAIDIMPHLDALQAGGWDTLYRLTV